MGGDTLCVVDMFWVGGVALSLVRGCLNPFRNGLWWVLCRKISVVLRWFALGRLRMVCMG